MNDHNKIIRQVANAVFLPKGFFQKGNSRTWLYDCGYGFVIVEFSPSAYTKGTFCNVALSFMFDYYGHLNECFAFHYGWERISLGKFEFVEYKDNDEQFESQVFQLAKNALKYAENLKEFQSLKYADKQMSNLLFRKKLNKFFGRWSGPVDDYYNAAMIKFLSGKLDDGKRSIKKLNSLRLESPFKEWAEKSYAEFCREDITAEEAKNKVCEMVNARRNYFRQKSCYRKMPELVFGE